MARSWAAPLLPESQLSSLPVAHSLSAVGGVAPEHEDLSDGVAMMMDENEDSPPDYTVDTCWLLEII